MRSFCSTECQPNIIKQIGRAQCYLEVVAVGIRQHRNIATLLACFTPDKLLLVGEDGPRHASCGMSM